jgi:hypothetical protein
MTVAKITLGIAAMASLLLVFATRQTPSAQEAAAAQVKAEAEFDAAWDDTLRMSGATALRKANQERFVSPEPRVVSTERVVPEPAATPAPAPTVVPPIIRANVEEDDDPKPRRARKHTTRRDVCARHNMRKVLIRGGKSWRCRK